MDVNEYTPKTIKANGKRLFMICGNEKIKDTDFILRGYKQKYTEYEGPFLLGTVSAYATTLIHTPVNQTNATIYRSI